MISASLAPSGAPPAVASITSAHSRKYCGLRAAGVTRQSAFASWLPRLSKRWTARRGMHNACPGLTSICLPSTYRSEYSSIRSGAEAINLVKRFAHLVGNDFAGQGLFLIPTRYHGIAPFSIETVSSPWKVRIQGASRILWYTTPEKALCRGGRKCETCLPSIKRVSLRQFLSFFVVILPNGGLSSQECRIGFKPS